MTDLKERVARIIATELRGTIPPSFDPMRSKRFESAAEAAIKAVREADSQPREAPRGYGTADYS
jgi:hypothetical protein